MTLFKEKLGEILVRKNIITGGQLTQALEYQRENRVRLGGAIVQLGFATEDEISKIISAQLKIHYISDLDEIAINRQIINEADMHILLENLFIPLEVETEDGIKKISVVCGDVYNEAIREACVEMYGLEPSYKLAKPGDIRKWIENYIRRSQTEESRKELLDDAADSNVYDLNTLDENPWAMQEVNSLLIDACRRGASDIHIDPQRGKTHVYFRIDGDRDLAASYKHHDADRLVRRLKNMAGCNSVERKRPQDGSFRAIIDSFPIDFRLSAVNADSMELVTLRVLDPRMLETITINDLGLNAYNEERIRRLINSPNGVFIVAGATNTGKTTTIHTLLQIKQKSSPSSLAIRTIEDPIEYRMDGLVQTQVNDNPKINYTFATGLKTFLRHDCDIILAGEMRDETTAMYAMRHATVGTLLFSTVHADDAVSVVLRLWELGVPSYKIAESLLGASAQKLVKKICPFCSEPYELHVNSAALSKAFRVKIGTRLELRRGAGCVKCGGRGFSGRIPLQEVFIVTDRIKRAIYNNDLLSVREIAVEEGLIPMYYDGVEKVLAGITTLEEVEKETRIDVYPYFTVRK